MSPLQGSHSFVGVYPGLARSSRCLGYYISRLRRWRAERILHFLEGHGETVLPIIAEARGKTEDTALAASFFRLLHDGTRSVPGERFRELSCPMTFVKKQQNIAGTQLADLCGYPASRHILKPEQRNLAFDSVREHLYQRESESGLQVLQ